MHTHEKQIVNTQNLRLQSEEGGIEQLHHSGAVLESPFEAALREDAGVGRDVGGDGWDHRVVFGEGHDKPILAAGKDPRLLAVEQLDQRHADTPDVVRRADFAARSLRGHVPRRPAHVQLPVARAGVLPVDSRSKVRQLAGPVVAQQRIVRLDVAVRDAVFVQALQTAQDVLQVAAHSGQRQRAELVEQLSEGPARHVLHEDDEVVGHECTRHVPDNVVVAQVRECVHLLHQLLRVDGSLCAQEALHSY